MHMMTSWGVTAAVLLTINLVTAWQLPFMTQLILISPFVVFNFFLTFRKQENTIKKKQRIILAAILIAFIGVSFGMFSEDYFMIAVAIAVSLPVVLVAYLIFMKKETE